MMRPMAKYYVVSVKTQPFSPLDLSPALWLDASDTTTITESSGAVSEWRDKSGNARHVSQGTAAAQPTTGSATINGKNVLSFDGGDMLTRSGVELSAFFANNTDNMTFVVMRGKNITASAKTMFYIIKGSERLGLDVRSSAAYYDATNTTTGRTTANVSSTDDVAYGWAGYRSGASMVLRRNGTQQGTNSSASGSVTAGTATIRVGGDGAGFFQGGEIAEIIVVAGYDAQGFSDCETYLANKWGI